MLFHFFSSLVVSCLFQCVIRRLAFLCSFKFIFVLFCEFQWKATKLAMWYLVTGQTITNRKIKLNRTESFNAIIIKVSWIDEMSFGLSQQKQKKTQKKLHNFNFLFVLYNTRRHVTYPHRNQIFQSRDHLCSMEFLYLQGILLYLIALFTVVS